MREVVPVIRHAASRRRSTLDTMSYQMRPANYHVLNVGVRACCDNYKSLDLDESDIFVGELNKLGLMSSKLSADLYMYNSMGLP